MKDSKMILVLLMSLFFLDCEKEEESCSGPEISWGSKVTTTYSYSSGVLSGFTTFRSFTVSNNEVGEIKITAATDKSEKSCTYNVEPDKDYKTIIKSRISNPYGSSVLTVSSSSAFQPWSVNFKDWEVTVYSVSITVIN